MTENVNKLRELIEDFNKKTKTLKESAFGNGEYTFNFEGEEVKVTKKYDEELTATIGYINGTGYLLKKKLDSVIEILEEEKRKKEKVCVKKNKVE